MSSTSPKEIHWILQSRFSIETTAGAIELASACDELESIVHESRSQAQRSIKRVFTLQCTSSIQFECQRCI